MQSAIRAFIAKINGWATRSLVIGFSSTVLDQSTSALLKFIFDVPTRYASMTGTALGSIFAFLMNRKYAFKDSSSSFAATALRYAIVTSLQIYAHGHLVDFIVNRLGDAIFPIAKLIADLCVFTFLNLVLLRYVVFPKSAQAPTQQ